MRIFYHFCFVVLTSSMASAQSRADTDNLVPDFYSMQHGGSIGYLSVGAGYNIGSKTRLSVHYGFVPEDAGGPLHVVAAKFMYSPWQIEIDPKVKLNLLDVGLFFSYHFGQQFASSWPSYRYPDGYYWWKTSLRYHLGIENSLRVYTNGTIQSVSLYVELNTNDLYLVSYVKNTDALNLIDILKLGVGVRFHLD